MNGVTNSKEVEKRDVAITVSLVHFNKTTNAKKYYAVNGSVLGSVNDVLLAGEAIPKSSLYTP